VVQDLLNAARGAKRNAYAPYSGFRVGAAVRGGRGGIYAGCNVENAAYPQGTCAEASAVAAMVAAGEHRIEEVLVVSDGEEPCPPCGGCRQILSEFAAGGVEVHLYTSEGLHRTIALEDLMPMPFGLHGPR
jgi:cytidine deaminase